MQHDEARAENHACDDAETAARAYSAWIVVNVLVGDAAAAVGSWLRSRYSLALYLALSGSNAGRILQLPSVEDAFGLSHRQ